jgi:hypothetical protein
MTVNQFNSKINLPALASHLGIRGLEFVNVPKFGWFAHDRDRTDSANFLTIQKWTAKQAYQYLTKDHPELLESKVLYSEHTQNRIHEDAARQQTYRVMFSMCLEEMEHGRVRTHHGKSKAKVIVEELGLPMFRQNMIGMITSKVIATAQPAIGISDQHCDRFILASFAAPTLPCSYESVNLYDLSKRQEIYTNTERGWYGVLNHRICKDITEFGAFLGNTWDKKADYWQTKVVPLSHQLTDEQCMRIWLESKLAAFDKNPIEVIMENQHGDFIKNYTKGLNLVQLRELEKLTDLKLFDNWKKNQLEELTIGGIRFIQRDFRYYFVLAGGEEVEYTNFIVKITKVKKDGDRYVYCGLINYNGSEVPCEIPDTSFRSSYTLINYLRTFFLEAGIGIPVVTPTYKQYLLYVIQKFSENALVDNSIPVS